MSHTPVWRHVTYAGVGASSMDFRACSYGEFKIFEKSWSMNEVSFTSGELILWGMKLWPRSLILWY